MSPNRSCQDAKFDSCQMLFYDVDFGSRKSNAININLMGVFASRRLWVKFPAVIYAFTILIDTSTQDDSIILTSAVNNGEKHLVDFIRQPDGKSLGILGQVT